MNSRTSSCDKLGGRESGFSARRVEMRSRRSSGRTEFDFCEFSRSFVSGVFLFFWRCFSGGAVDTSEILVVKFVRRVRFEDRDRCPLRKG